MNKFSFATFMFFAFSLFHSIVGPSRSSQGGNDSPIDSPENGNRYSQPAYDSEDEVLPFADLGPFSATSSGGAHKLDTDTRWDSPKKSSFDDEHFTGRLTKADSFSSNPYISSVHEMAKQGSPETALNLLAGLKKPPGRKSPSSFKSSMSGSGSDRDHVDKPLLSWGPNEKPNEQDLIDVERMKKYNPLYEEANFHPKLLNNVPDWWRGNWVFNGRLYYPAPYEEKRINGYPLSDKQMALGLDQDIMHNRIWAQVEQEWSHHSGINAELAVILYEHQNHWKDLIGETKEDKLIYVHSATDILMEALVKATNKPAFTKLFDAADSSDLIEVLVTLTEEQRQKMNSPSNTSAIPKSRVGKFEAFCNTDLPNNKEVKATKRYKLVMTKLCKTVRDQKFETDEKEAKKSAKLLNYYLSGKLELNEKRKKETKKKPVQATFAEETEEVEHLKMETKKKPVQATVAEENEEEEHLKMSVNQAEEEITTLLTEINYSQLRLILQYAIGEEIGHQQTILGPTVGNRKKVGEESIDLWLAKMTEGKKNDHFWQTVNAIVTDAVKGRPHFFAPLLKTKLAKLLDDTGFNDADAHADIVRILITRSQIDLVDILDLLKDWQPAKKLIDIGDKSSASGRNQLRMGSSRRLKKTESRIPSVSIPPPQMSPGANDSPVETPEAETKNRGVLAALELAVKKAKDESDKARVKGYIHIVNLIQRPEWLKKLNEQYQDHLHKLKTDVWEEIDRIEEEKTAKEKEKEIEI